MDFGLNYVPGGFPNPGVNATCMQRGMPKTKPMETHKEPSLGGTPTGSPI